MAEPGSGGVSTVAGPRTVRAQPAGAMKVLPTTVVLGVSPVSVSEAAAEADVVAVAVDEDWDVLWEQASRASGSEQVRIRTRRGIAAFGCGINGKCDWWAEAAIANITRAKPDARIRKRLCDNILTSVVAKVLDILRLFLYPALQPIRKFLLPYPQLDPRFVVGHTTGGEILSVVAS
jgi:hypothetical protein